MLIDVFRKPKDKFEFVKKYLDSAVCSNSINPYDRYDKWLDLATQDIINIFDNNRLDDKNSEIKSIAIYLESRKGAVTLTADELREIYEVLNSKGFIWERGETC